MRQFEKLNKKLERQIIDEYTVKIHQAGGVSQGTRPYHYFKEINSLNWQEYRVRFMIEFIGNASAFKDGIYYGCQLTLHSVRDNIDGMRNEMTQIMDYWSFHNAYLTSRLHLPIRKEPLIHESVEGKLLVWPLWLDLGDYQDIQEAIDTLKILYEYVVTYISESTAVK